MNRMQKAVAILLFLLVLLPPCASLAEENPADAPATAEIADSNVSQDQETETIAEPPKINVDEGLCRQIRDTYAAAKKLGRRSSFKGYCGAYVANQLVALGINTTRLSANGNKTYDIYRGMDHTSGGYRVLAYGAKKYTLSEALRAIMEDDPAACNILVGFEKGTSKAGRKYGHVLFIHGIRSGRIYYSDSSARTVDGVKYKEGEPIVCSLDAFLDEYAKCKLDGVIHFLKAAEVTTRSNDQSSITEETAATRSEKLVAVG